MSAPDVSPPTVHTVTTARRSLAEDQDMRIRRYLLSMGIRTVCFVLMYVIDHPIRWIFLLGAAVLPYLAVVLANAVDHRSEGELQPVDHSRTAIGVRSEGVLEGRVVDDPAPGGATRQDEWV
ncbi:DUF3099 domain-containing protein [Arsenicicoccus dermatophilus]|uniref:DUF3099 domain-containing protein n=1 Tax=Arsenicicoccus dermatophilus TaxID=1076331 RepID=UPI001F4D07A7|nr:DUF3099 domain-containing protein [Arsenicicoccus dermatophilus]